MSNPRMLVKIYEQTVLLKRYRKRPYKDEIHLKEGSA